MYYSLPISIPLQVMVVLCTFILCGCMSFEEGWKQFKKPTKTGDVTELLKEAQDQINQADTKVKVVELIKTYESVLEIDPYNYEALWSLGRYFMLCGALYMDKIEEKKKYYTASIKYCEQALYTNPEFKALVDRGTKVWDACKVLSEREMAPMYYWYFSQGAYMYQCLNPISQLINLIPAVKGKKVLDRMMEIDPTWAGGHPYNAMALRYVTVPRLLGGDLKRAEEFFEKAIEAGPNWLYIRFDRARFLYTKTRNKEAFKRDLEWTIAQDPHEADSPYPANVWIQREAKEMLENINDYF